MSSATARDRPTGGYATNITDAALALLASLNTSRGCTMLESRLPMDTVAVRISRFLCPAAAPRKCSFFLPFRSPATALTTSLGLVTGCLALRGPASIRRPRSKAAFNWAALAGADAVYLGQLLHELSAMPCQAAELAHSFCAVTMTGLILHAAAQDERQYLLAERASAPSRISLSRDARRAAGPGR